MPQMGHDTKTDRLTDCQSQCDSDSELLFSQLRVTVEKSQKLVAEAGTVREPRGRGTSAAENRY
jgi:hypothetical protein